MSIFKVNFDDIKEDFTPIPAGVYPVVFVDYSEEEGPAAPYVAVTFEITEGEYAKRNLWTNISMSPKAAWKLKEAMIAFGEPAETLIGDVEFDPERYVGVECRAAVIQEPYEGKQVNKIDSLLPPKGLEPSSGTSTPKTTRATRPKIR